MYTPTDIKMEAEPNEMVVPDTPSVREYKKSPNEVADDLGVERISEAVSPLIGYS
ncbi:MAG: hypothetical protein H6Q04_2836 [Acidobacteria bacterium]|nr:hypothetical protein [Acidobacteriota bacterium]